MLKAVAGNLLGLFVGVVTTLLPAKAQPAWNWANADFKVTIGGTCNDPVGGFYFDKAYYKTAPNTIATNDKFTGEQMFKRQIAACPVECGGCINNKTGRRKTRRDPGGSSGEERAISRTGSFHISVDWGVAWVVGGEATWTDNKVENINFDAQSVSCPGRHELWKKQKKMWWMETQHLAAAACGANRKWEDASNDPTYGAPPAFTYQAQKDEKYWLYQWSDKLSCRPGQ